MLVSDMKATCLDMLGESTYDRFSEAEILRWLNLCSEDIAGKTEYMKSEAVWTTTANEEEIPFPSNAVSIFRIEYDGEELEKTSRDKLDEQDADWEDADTGPPEKWYSDRHMTYALKPKPDDAYEITVYYISTDDTLTGDSSSPNVPKPWHQGYCLFAAGWMKIGDGEVMAGNKYLKMYSDIVFGQARRIAKRDKFGTTTVRIGLAKWNYRDD